MMNNEQRLHINMQEKKTKKNTHTHTTKEGTLFGCPIFTQKP